MKFLVEQVKTANNEVVRRFKAQTLEDAIAIARSTVDAYLQQNRDDNASADALYSWYRDNGVMLRVLDGQTLHIHEFDHLHYASLQCLRLYKERNLSLPSRSLDFTRKH